MRRFPTRALSTACVFAITTIATAQTSTLTIPKSLQGEHHELFESMEAAAKSGGKTGEAAQRALTVLKPHFEKEERFALPQLGALESISKKDATLSADMRTDLMKRADTFRTELPKMLDEHKSISAALREMHDAALAEHKEKFAELAEKILGHAAMEEEIIYPTSLLIGEYARKSGGIP